LGPLVEPSLRDPVSANTMLKHDRQAKLLLVCGFGLLYAYFFQGGGWNQNTHFDTARALVERHTFELSAFSQNTGDVGRHEGKVYSNKGPGLALLTVPVYFVTHQLERALAPGADPARRANMHAHIMTLFASALPGVVLLLVLYCHFRRAQGSIGESLCLAAAFGAGTLIFPFSGLLMSHVLTACTLFSTWYLVSRPPARNGTLFLAGSLVGLTVITDLLAAPVTALFLFYVMRRYRPREITGFIAGGAAVALLFLVYNYAAFGSIFKTNQTLEQKQFQTPDLLLGALQVPEPIRLYWLTFHPFRGLFHCCPVLLLPWLSWPRALRWRALRLETLVPLAVIFVFMLFNLSFNGWTGGWGVGPRYLIPMTPFLFSFALPGLRRARVPALLLMAASAGLMFCVTAVRVMVPGPTFGSAPNWDPVADCVEHVTRGEVAISTQGMLDYVPRAPSSARWASYNLGELFGLQGAISLLPAALVLGLLAVVALVTSRRALTRRRTHGGRVAELPASADVSQNVHKELDDQASVA